MRSIQNAWKLYDKLPTWLVTLFHYLAMCLSCAAMVLYYWIFHEEQFVQRSIDTPLSRTFTPGSDSLNYVLIACIGSIATGMAMTLDLVIDFMGFEWNALIDDRLERAITVAILTIPSLVLIIYCATSSVAGLFALCHAIQLITSYNSVVALCHRLYPGSFTNSRSSLAIVLCCVAGTSSVIGFGYEATSIANFTTLIFLGSSFAILGYTTYQWLLDELLLENSKILYWYLLSAKEIYTLAYLGSMVLTVVTAGIKGMTVFCVWTQLEVSSQNINKGRINKSLIKTFRLTER